MYLFMDSPWVLEPPFKLLIKITSFVRRALRFSRSFRCKHGCRLQRLQHESLQRGNEARWHRLSLPRFLRALVDSSERVSTEEFLSPVEMRRRETRVREVPIRRVRDSIVDERVKNFFFVVSSPFSSFGVPFCSFARVLAHFANGFF